MSSKSIYIRLYESICEDRKSKRDQYGPGSGLHEHHILPKHSGGTDDIHNLTYLTVREHIIAHFLLWKINRDVNDLRSMNMLGANLSVEKRRTIGKWCYENKIGWHKYTKEEKSRIGKQQQLDRIANGKENEWDFWGSKEGRLLRSSMGGKKGGKTTASKQLGGWFCSDPEERKRLTSLGGKMAPKFPVFDTINSIVKKLHSDEERKEFLLNNPSFILGYGSKTCDISKKPKFPCCNIELQQRLYFVTREERDNFVKENPEWIPGRNLKK